MLPVLQANGLTKAYGRHQVLSDITLQIAAGTLVGIVGENGAGKSTLLNLLAGALAPTRGSIQIAGTLGYCPQTVILNEALTVAQHLDYFQAAYHLASNASADRLIECLRFAQYRAAPVSTLSGGTKQKLNLTLALMHDPSILLRRTLPGVRLGDLPPVLGSCPGPAPAGLRSSGNFPPLF